MVGHPKHVPKALEVGVDIICAQVRASVHTGIKADLVGRRRRRAYWHNTNLSPHTCLCRSVQEPQVFPNRRTGKRGSSVDKAV